VAQRRRGGGHAAPRSARRRARSERGSSQLPHARVHHLLWVLAGACALLLGALAWLGWTGIRARAELDSARADTNLVRASLVAGNGASAHAALEQAQAHADAARKLTSDRLWRLAGAIPFLGRTPRAVTETTEALDQAVTDVVPGLVAAAAALDPTRLRHDGAIDLSLIASAAPAIEEAQQRLDLVRERVDAVPLNGVLGPVARGIRGVRTQLSAVAGDVDPVAAAARLLPTMLGASGPRTYLVVFQNNAEARGTGGLVGAYAVVVADHGSLRVTRMGSDTDLRSASVPVLDLGPAYRQIFGDDPTLWANTNLSANFPSAARQQLELWRRQFGQSLDGVVAVDPVLLGYLLDVTGPAVLPDRTTVSGTDVADLTMRQVYARFPDPAQTTQRKEYLQVLAAAALGRVLSGNGSARAEVAALARGASERRLLVFSAHPDEQAVLQATPLGGVVDDRPGPYAALVLDNASGNKLDYYVDRTLVYQLGCQSPTASQASTITVRLHDGAPARGLPEYAAYRLDLGSQSSNAGRGGDGSTRETVMVYASEGAQLAGATLDGASLQVTPGIDGAGTGRPVFVFSVVLAAGQTRTAVLRVTEPPMTGPVRAWVQPLVRPATTTVVRPTCR
jgi:Protein of unknown function (DUF4012)